MIRQPKWKVCADEEVNNTFSLEANALLSVCLLVVVQGAR